MPQKVSIDHPEPSSEESSKGMDRGPQLGDVHMLGVRQDQHSVYSYWILNSYYCM